MSLGVGKRVILSKVMMLVEECYDWTDFHTMSRLHLMQVNSVIWARNSMPRA